MVYGMFLALKTRWSVIIAQNVVWKRTLVELFVSILSVFSSFLDAVLQHWGRRILYYIEEFFWIVSPAQQIHCAMFTQQNRSVAKVYLLRSSWRSCVFLSVIAVIVAMPKMTPKSNFDQYRYARLLAPPSVLIRYLPICWSSPPALSY